MLKKNKIEREEVGWVKKVFVSTEGHMNLLFYLLLMANMPVYYISFFRIPAKIENMKNAKGYLLGGSW